MPQYAFNPNRYLLQLQKFVTFQDARSWRSCAPKIRHKPCMKLGVLSNARVVESAPAQVGGAKVLCRTSSVYYGSCGAQSISSYLLPSSAYEHFSHHEHWHVCNQQSDAWFWQRCGYHVRARYSVQAVPWHRRQQHALTQASRVVCVHSCLAALIKGSSRTCCISCNAILEALWMPMRSWRTLRVWPVAPAAMYRQLSDPAPASATLRQFDFCTAL